MQEAILRLTRYWTDHGCVLAQPINTEVGAGTMNPATFLRVLGPEPWNTVYVEPSVRPDDSRYGDNPNRMQTHTQLQVILQPDPGNSQELYLGSLAAIGIDSSRHDIRFVEDNWESPALGAWGLGWEVWLDGLEITQFTYFQQAGGLVVDPVAVELTYGLERILMAVQGVRHFKDVQFSDSISYGEIVGEVEYEMSRYYLDEADVERVQQMFDTFEAEARLLIDQRMPIPAHSYVLKCSHAFNVLDARGAIGTTERARSFRRIRSLAHEVAELWVERRQELGHPLGVSSPAEPPPASESPVSPDEPSTFVLELGYEELPADEVLSYASQLETALGDALGEHRLAFDSIETFGTPRRIVAVVGALDVQQPQQTVRVRGPRSAAAFGPEGEPTKAAEGFARKHGVDVGDLVVTGDGEDAHVVVVKEEAGRPSVDVLAEILPDVIGSIRPRRSMRWSAGPSYSASRPLRRILALHGDHVVPFAYGDVRSGRVTQLLRMSDPPEREVASADGFMPALTAGGIAVSADDRRQQILAEVERLAGGAGGSFDAAAHAETVVEVVNMVEAPNAVLGGFDPSFLRLPAEVLSTVMKKHQRYLPIGDGAGSLLPSFVSIADGPIDVDAVRAGNEAVLRARFADAAFFYDRDLRRPLESYRTDLERLTFEESVGSMRDRSDRIADVAAALGRSIGLEPDEADTLARAAHLAKADLGTSLVIELPALAGEMGRIYALAQGETDEVAQAIFESCLPRFAGDALPASHVGAILSVADRADALVALFAAGAAPTGSNDPYGLRRAATGLVLVLESQDFPIDLRDLLDVAADRVELEVDEKTMEDLLAFVRTRHEVRLIDEGHRPEFVRSVLSATSRPADVRRRLGLLESSYATTEFGRVAQALRRVSRISRGVDSAPVDENRLVDDAEAALWRAFAPMEERLVAGELDRFVGDFMPLVERIDTFFDDVLVMAEDSDLRANRLALLARIRETGAHLLDWEAVPDTEEASAGSLS